MLSNREAALLRGQWWECADDGVQVWQRLTIKPAPETIARHASEAVAVTRAVRQLKRRRIELALQLDQLIVRFDAVSRMPMARLIARKNIQELQAQITTQRTLIAELPKQPIVHRLDPEASCGVLADAMTKQLVAEVTDAEHAEIPEIIVPAIVVPRPAAKPAARVEPVVTAPKPALDSIESFAAEPFDESLLG